VRELENSIERAVVLADGPSIQASDVFIQDVNPENAKEENNQFDFKKLTQSKVITIEELISRYAKHVLEINSGAKDKTAKDLGNRASQHHEQRSKLYSGKDDRSSRVVE
jgi:two-component system response regulator HydG